MICLYKANSNDNKAIRLSYCTFLFFFYYFRTKSLLKWDKSLKTAKYPGLRFTNILYF